METRFIEGNEYVDRDAYIELKKENSHLYETIAVLNGRIEELKAVLIMVRDADNDCHKDGLQTIPPIARRKLDEAIKGEGDDDSRD